EYQKNVLKKPMPAMTAAKSETHSYFIDVMRWSMEEAIGFLKYCYPQCLAEVKIKPGAAETFHWLQKNGHEANILSSRVNAKGDDAFQITKKWLSENGIKPDSITIACKNKGDYLKGRQGVFIDDAFDHTEAASKNPGITVFQINSRFVKASPSPKVRHFSSWDELRGILIRLFPSQFDK
nr:hypothetical protein [Elusimicrobiales bacterium]